MGGHSDYSIGDLKWSIQAVDHEYWLKCDGRSLLRTRFPALFDLIGTTYGNDDSQTFKLPDCRGRVVGCIGTGSGLTQRASGTMIGAETHTLTTPEMPSHTHSVNDPGHTHVVSNTVQKTGSGTPGSIDNDGNEIDTTTTFNTTTTTSTTGITISATGGGMPHNNMQPTIFIGNVFIAYKSQSQY